MLIKLSYDCYAKAEDISYFIAEFEESAAKFTFKNGDTIKVGIEKYDLDDEDTSYINDYMETLADLINANSLGKIIKLSYDCYARAEDISYFIADFYDGVVRFTFKDGSTIRVGVEKCGNDDDDTSYIDDYMEAISDLINNKS